MIHPRKTTSKHQDKPLRNKKRRLVGNPEKSRIRLLRDLADEVINLESEVRILEEIVNSYQIEVKRDADSTQTSTQISSKKSLIASHEPIAFGSFLTGFLLGYALVLLLYLH